MDRVILRTRRNGVFTGIRRDFPDPAGKAGVAVEIDQATGLLVWCPQGEVEELITLSLPDAAEDNG